MATSNQTANALIIAAAAGLTLAGAWTAQGLGYLPCDLCYLQRQPYYVGLGFALALAALSRWRVPRGLIGAAFAYLACVFVVGCGLAIYHSGVEWKFWPGPSACAGSAFSGGGDLLAQLQTVKVVRCDEPSLRLLGLSLANFNIFISAAIAAYAARAAAAIWRAR